MSEISTEDLQALRDQLMGMQRGLEKRLGKIEATLFRDSGPLEADSQEQAQQMENDEVLTALDDSGREDLAHIGAALQRMDAGEYGKCIECDEAIGLRRLQALPFAMLCIKCAAAHEK